MKFIVLVCPISIKIRIFLLLNNTFSMFSSNWIGRLCAIEKWNFDPIRLNLKKKREKENQSNWNHWCASVLCFFWDSEKKKIQLSKSVQWKLGANLLKKIVVKTCAKFVFFFIIFLFKNHLHQHQWFGLFDWSAIEIIQTTQFEHTNIMFISKLTQIVCLFVFCRYF